MNVSQRLWFSLFFYLKNILARGFFAFSYFISVTYVYAAELH